MNIGVYNNVAHIIPEAEIKNENLMGKYESIFHFDKDLDFYHHGNKTYFFTTVGLYNNSWCGLIRAEGKVVARRLLKMMIKDKKGNYLYPQIYEVKKFNRRAA